MEVFPIDTVGDSEISNILKAIGDEKRFQIIKLLLEGDLCVGALARILNISKPAVSQHLKILRESGLVRGEKIGYWTHYRVERNLLLKVAQYLKDLSGFAPGQGGYKCLKERENNNLQERKVLQMCKDRCEHPERLKTVPGECSPEQIKECHGDQADHSCAGGCEQPNQLKTVPSACSTEQVRLCHGDSGEHPCKDN